MSRHRSSTAEVDGFAVALSGGFVGVSGAGAGASASGRGRGGCPHRARSGGRTALPTAGERARGDDRVPGEAAGSAGASAGLQVPDQQDSESGQVDRHFQNVEAGEFAGRTAFAVSFCLQRSCRRTAVQQRSLCHHIRIRYNVSPVPPQGDHCLSGDLCHLGIDISRNTVWRRDHSVFASGSICY